MELLGGPGFACPVPVGLHTFAHVKTTACDSAGIPAFHAEKQATTMNQDPNSPSTTSPAAPQAKPRRGWFRAIVVWLLKAVKSFILFLFLAWATLALFYYLKLSWPILRFVSITAFVAFGVWALWLTRRWSVRLLFVALYVGVYMWWRSILPSHDRLWRPEVAVMPRAIIDGDRIKITGFRNFTYRTRDDFTLNYEEREFLLSHLTSVDFFVSYWKIGPVAHTFVSFNFDNALPLSISIETRPEVGEGFDPVGSLFKQFELIYVAGDERDIVGVRTNHRDEDVFLYRMRVSPEASRRLLLVYLERMNELADKAEHYHLLSNNCTLNIVRYANRAGRKGGFDIRHLLNGFIDQYLFAVGAIKTALPFEELRRRSRVNDAAKAAEGAPDFSARIREGLPVPAPE